eukprot:CAMPEP_0197832052 /NCGR_PEP_ID=MMETSP1437-20131217/13089_1 /TAXON_ID=49252 ORGANISM="Eucampia antarctica, Strain CCMP1452" /NCGR_SAMPLE_ID=MMETSP1437 /ASSEMBLY_ACC=CAM_ASM_001096 /LENGTH=382 /DNA_ID=CAMNT_0043435227 /DNA_START=18 /DNA_END=1166 /DNA_ORIENTATION=+
MTSKHIVIIATCLTIFLSSVSSFIVSFRQQPLAPLPYVSTHRSASSASRLYQQITLLPDLEDEDKVRSLFSWICMALTSSDPEYNNVMLAFVAIFASPPLPDTSEPAYLLKEALKTFPIENDDNECTPVGQAFSSTQREQSSLGAMGAAQWTGQFKTRPHAILDVRSFTSVDEWVKTLPRGCKRTIKKAIQGNFTVTPKPICGGQLAPHSCLAHFRCVVEHEVRLLSKEYGPQVFFDALSEAINRYMGTTRMAGTVHEYRSETNNTVIAIAHTVQKGRVLRGQWFYANDKAAQQYVWFHSVYQLVQKAIETPNVDVVDLGPSGTDSFSELKERYGFESVEDWPAVADYTGPFVYDTEEQTQDEKEGASLTSLLEQMMRRGNF